MPASSMINGDPRGDRNRQRVVGGVVVLGAWCGCERPSAADFRVPAQERSASVSRRRTGRTERSRRVMVATGAVTVPVRERRRRALMQAARRNAQPERSDGLVVHSTRGACRATWHRVLRRQESAQRGDSRDCGGNRSSFWIRPRRRRPVRVRFDVGELHGVLGSRDSERAPDEEVEVHWINRRHCGPPPRARRAAQRPARCGLG